MFKYFLISIVIAPVLLGVALGSGRAMPSDRSRLRLAWTTYAVLWVATLYVLRRLWT